MQEMQVWSLGGEDPLEEENGNPLQYSCLGNSMNRGAWWATVHGVSKNRTGLSYWALNTRVLSELKYMKLSLCKICPWCCQLFYDVYRICQHPIVNWHRFASLCCASSLSHVQVFATPWTVAHKAPLFMVFSGQAYWSGLPFATPEDLPNQGSNPGLPHCGLIVDHLSHQGSPLLSYLPQRKETNVPKQRIQRPPPPPPAAVAFPWWRMYLW